MYGFAKVSGKLLSIALPMGASYTFSASIVVAGWLASRVPGESNDNLAISSLIMTMLSTLVSIAQAPAFAMPIYINYRRGQLEAPESQLGSQNITMLREEIAGVLKASMMLTAPNIIIPMLAMCFSKWVLADLFGQDPKVAAGVQAFLRPYALGLPAVALMRISFEQILFSYEQQIAVMTLALGSFALGAGLAYWFCFGGGPVSAMGVSGAAYGLLAEAFITPILFAACLILNKKLKEFDFFSQLFTWPNRQKDLPQVIELAQSGLPILLTTISQVLAPFAISTFAGQYDDKKHRGTETLAALSFSSWLSFALIILMLALGQAVAQETNRQLGREQKKAEGQGFRVLRESGYKKTASTARMGLGLTALVMSVLSLIPIIWPELITNAVGTSDADNQNVILEGQAAVRIVAIGMIFESMANTMTQTLRSLKDGNVATGISLGGHWAGVLLGYLMAFSMDLGAAGLVAGPAIASGLSCIVLLYRFTAQTEREVLARISTQSRNEGIPSISNCWRARSMRGVEPAAESLHSDRPRALSINNEERPLLTDRPAQRAVLQNTDALALTIPNPGSE